MIMKIVKQPNVKRNQVIKNDQVVVQLMMMMSHKIIMMNNYPIMNKMIMKVIVKINQNENQ